VRRAARLAVASLALSLAGCASGALGGGGGGNVDRRIAELERETLRQRVELDRLARRLAELEREQALAAPTAPAARPATPPPVPAAGPAAELPDAPVDLPAAAPPPPGAAIEVAELAEPSASEETPAEPIDDYERALELPIDDYERALELFRAGRTREAEAALRALLDRGVTPDLGDNVWFWIGESRLGRGDAAGAIAAYRSAIEAYPDGNKIPDALLKLGDALVELGDADGAQAVWRELVERFPATASAELARPRLEPR